MSVSINCRAALGGTRHIGSYEENERLTRHAPANSGIRDDVPELLEEGENMSQFEGGSRFNASWPNQPNFCGPCLRWPLYSASVILDRI